MTHSTEREQGDRILKCRDIELAFGGLRALKSVSLEITKGQIFGLVGPNGSGKTSMVNVITGFYRPQSGSVNLFGEEVIGLKPHRIAARGVARTFQNLALFRGMTVLDNILLGRHVHMGASALASLFYWVWALRSEVANRRVVEELIDFMQIQDIRDEPVEVIPLGMQKRVELARALAAEPTLLILDEPMAGMNQEEKEYIARFILDAREERNTTILLIEHHMDVVTALCDRVLVLSYGENIAEGEPEQTIADPRVVSAYLPSVARRQRHEHAAAPTPRDVVAGDRERPARDSDRRAGAQCGGVRGSRRLPRA
jgi:branched-chain amino acid transport system ATP-binding protein